MNLIISYIKRHLGSFCAALVFLTIEAAADLLQPTFMSYIVDRGVKNNDIRQIVMYGLIMLGIAALGAFGAVMRNIFASRTSQMIGKDLRSDLFRKIQTLSLENIDHLQPASLITRVTNDVTQIQGFINGCMRIMVKAPITCIGAIALIVFQTPRQIPVMLVILLISALLILANMSLGYPRFGRMQLRLDRLNKVSREFLTSIRVVKAFNAESREEEKFDTASMELARASVSASRVMAVFGPLISLTVNMGIVVLLWLSENGNTEIGKIMASVNYMTQILFALGMVSMILNSAVRALASSERVAEVLSEEPAQKKVRNPEDPEWRGSVVFEDVSFGYGDAEEEALSHVSFCVNAGETVGIIGPTGSGKSTLVNLLPRFYDAKSGAILIDGADVTKVSEKGLRSAVAVVAQKALLFTGTIRENLCWGRQDASEEEIRQACRIACADEFVSAMPDRYETKLGQGGVNLSGGQKQRLALARALLRRPKILILDDCTSALDAQTEARVLQGLRSELSGVNVFLISQRISTVRRADHILVLNGGKVDGFQNHDSLMQSCATYQAIYHSQIGGGVNG